MLTYYCPYHRCTTQTTSDAIGVWRTPPGLAPATLDTCTPHNHVVYIKTHKTGSTTLQQVIQMYGYRRHLSFLFNAHSPSNGHIRYSFVSKTTPHKFLPPINVTAGDFANYKGYDILAAHVKYNRTVLDWYMANDSKYISIIREPAGQFESAFDFFKIAEKMTKTDRRLHLTRKRHDTGPPIDRWLRSPDIYLRGLGGPHSTAWVSLNNGQMLDLGMEPEHVRDLTMITRAVESLSKQMDLVLITEYYDESLVLLKKLLCWSFEDIVYFTLNQRHARRKLRETTKHKIRAWNQADVILYAHFNDTLWKRIEEYGPTFQDDLDTFRKIKKDINDKCLAKTNTHLDHKGIVRYRSSYGSPAYCKLYTDRKAVFNELWKRQKGSSPKHMKNGKHDEHSERLYSAMKKRHTPGHIQWEGPDRYHRQSWGYRPHGHEWMIGQPHHRSSHS